MHTTCSNILCTRIFLGDAAAWDFKNRPLCANCYNEMIRLESIRRGKPITDEDMRKAVEDWFAKHSPPSPPSPFSGFNPPTMG